MQKPVNAVDYRKFNLSDGMALIAAIAVGLVWSQFLLPLSWCRETFQRGGIVRGILSLLTWFAPLLSAFTFTVFTLQLRKPRPRWRRLTYQPGFMACAVATLGLMIGSSLILGTCWKYREYTPKQFGYSARHDLILDIVTYTRIWIGGAIAGSWITLMSSQRWRLERNWVDRFGCFLGTLWIAQFFLIIGLYIDQLL